MAFRLATHVDHVVFSAVHRAMSGLFSRNNPTTAQNSKHDEHGREQRTAENVQRECRPENAQQHQGDDKCGRGDHATRQARQHQHDAAQQHHAEDPGVERLVIERPQPDAGLGVRPQRGEDQRRAVNMERLGSAEAPGLPSQTHSTLSSCGSGLTGTQRCCFPQPH